MRNALAKFGDMLHRSWTTGPYSIRDAEFWGLMNVGAKSDSGVVVTRETALSMSAIWKGVNIIVNGCAKAGLHRYRRIGEHGKERDTGHPTYNMVRSQPNEYINAFDFWRTIIGHGVFEGNGYAAIERNKGGTAMALLLLDPACSYPMRVDGVLWYVTTVDYGQGKVEYLRLRAADVLHVRGFGYDGLCGYSILFVCANTIGGAIATRKHATTFFRNGANPAGILETPGNVDIKTLEDIRASWTRMHTGVDNANRTAILTNGMKFSATTMDAQKSQLLESRRFDLVELANLLLLPPHKLGDMSRSAYNSLEQEEKSVAADAFDPWWTAIECECDSKLLTAKERNDDSHYFRWNRRAALQTDAKAEAETLKIQKESGFITVDEGRGILDYGELPYGLGNVIDRPNANATTIDLGKEPEDDEAGDKDFWRQYAMTLASGGATADAMFNLTDVKSLLEEVNIPVFMGYNEPWLPVVSSNGQLVSGETITDSGGGIVGGDVVEPPEPEEPPMMDAEDDMEAAQKSMELMIKRSKKRQKRSILAARDAMADALRRKVRQLANEAKPAFSANFVEFVNGMDRRFGADFERATGPASAMIRAVGGDCGPVRGRFFGEIRDLLLLASECKASELSDRVGFVMSVAERSAKRLATMAALSGVKK